MLIIESPKLFVKFIVLIFVLHGSVFVAIFQSGDLCIFFFQKFYLLFQGLLLCFQLFLFLLQLFFLNLHLLLHHHLLLVQNLVNLGRDSLSC